MITTVLRVPGRTSTRRAVALLLAGALIAGCGAGPSETPTRPASVLHFIGTGQPERLFVDVATTDRARARGLMGRADLPGNQGMVFLFDGPTTDRFWMKDTSIPLSIAFWDGSNRLLAIVDMDPCTTDPCPTYGPGVPFVGAVEANRGYFAEHGIEPGDRVQLIRRGSA